MKTLINIGWHGIRIFLRLRLHPTWPHLFLWPCQAKMPEMVLEPNTWTLLIEEGGIFVGRNKYLFYEGGGGGGNKYSLTPAMSGI